MPQGCVFGDWVLVTRLSLTSFFCGYFFLVFDPILFFQIAGGFGGSKVVVIDISYIDTIS